MDISILNNSTMVEKIDTKTKKLSDKAQTNFMDIFSSATSKDINNIKDIKDVKKIVNKDNTNKQANKLDCDNLDNKDLNNKVTIRDDKTTNNNLVAKNNGELDNNDFSEKLASFTKDLKEDIKEILDIDDEKLEYILATLQVEVIQLVNPDIAKEVVLLANDSNTLSDVLVNEQLADDMTEMMDYFQTSQYQDILDIPLDEMNSLVEEATNRLYIKNTKEELSTNENNQLVEEMLANSSIYDLDEEKISFENASMNIKTDKNDNDSKINDKLDKDDLNFFELDSINNSLTEAKDISNDSNDSNSKNFNGNNTDDTKKQVDIEFVNEDSVTKTDTTSKTNREKVDFTSKTNDTVEQFVSKLDTLDSVEELTELENEVVYVKQLRDIVNQVTEKVKVTINNDTKKLEMNLNPKHLGKMSLDISENQGIITTKIKVESEMAKEALESGLQSLKESLEEKGIKVNAIEISVESTAVDINSRQNGGNFGQNKENEFAKKKGKKLNLDTEDLKLDTPSLEDEQVMIDGVLEQVSSVSYTV